MARLARPDPQTKGSKRAVAMPACEHWTTQRVIATMFELLAAVERARV